MDSLLTPSDEVRAMENFHFGVVRKEITNPNQKFYATDYMHYPFMSYYRNCSSLNELPPPGFNEKYVDNDTIVGLNKNNFQKTIITEKDHDIQVNVVNKNQPTNETKLLTKKNTSGTQINETIGQSMISETKNNTKGRNTTNISSSSSSSKSNIENDNNQVGNSKTKNNTKGSNTTNISSTSSSSISKITDNTSIAKRTRSPRSKSKSYESQQSNASIPSQLDLDHTPVRGPSSKESSSGLMKRRQSWEPRGIRPRTCCMSTTRTAYENGVRLIVSKTSTPPGLSTRHTCATALGRS